MLLRGPQGVGQFELATTLAQAWLCEATAPGPRPCGVCASCRLVQSHAHPDLMVLLPEALQEPLGWAPPEGRGQRQRQQGQAEQGHQGRSGARRRAVCADHLGTRPGVKVVVLHPAERMNLVSANTLLKTLEEPPGNARFLLSCAAPDALLPTIRSRCQAVPMALPPTAVAVQWLQDQGVAEAAVLLTATGGQPQEALAWSREGIDAALWLRLPALVMAGSAAAFTAWPLARLVDALQKLCHDAACLAAGAESAVFSVRRIAARRPTHVLDGIGAPSSTASPCMPSIPGTPVS